LKLRGAGFGRYREAFFQDRRGKSGGVSGACAVVFEGYFSVGRGRAAAPQELDIQVGMPRRGNTHFISTT
jgi:hypothetical protein